MTTKANGSEQELLLSIRGLRIEGQSDDEWHEIVKGVDFDLHRGEVLGLILLIKKIERIGDQATKSDDVSTA